MNLQLPRAIFVKYSKMKFYKNPSSGSRDVPWGQTDGHEKADSRRSQFCDIAQKRGVSNFGLHS
jgi:hypothetical protein